MNRSGLSELPWGTPKFILILGDSMLCILKNICLCDIKLLMNLMNWVGRPCAVSVWMSPVCQTLSKAFSMSMNTAPVNFFMFLVCCAVSVNWNILSCVFLWFY